MATLPAPAMSHRRKTGGLPMKLILALVGVIAIVVAATIVLRPTAPSGGGGAGPTDAFGGRAADKVQSGGDAPSADVPAALHPDSERHDDSGKHRDDAAQPGEAVKEKTSQPNSGTDAKQQPAKEADEGPAAVASEEWPGDADKRSLMWVFVYCAGQHGVGPVQEATSLGDLLTLAITMDFQVMVCVPTGRIPEAPHHPRLHWLPRSVSDMFDYEEAKQPLNTFDEAWAASPAGFLSQLDAINTHLEFRKLLVLSPLISLGDTQEEAHDMVEGLLQQGFTDRQDEGDETVVTPTIYGPAPPTTVIVSEIEPTPPPTKAGEVQRAAAEDAVPGGDDEARHLARLDRMQHPPSNVIVRGFKGREVAGSLFTIAPFLAGALEGSRLARSYKEKVYSPSGLLTVFSKAALDKTLHETLAIWRREAKGKNTKDFEKAARSARSMPDEVIGGSGDSANEKHFRWEALQVMAGRSATLRVDVALATLRLPTVDSLPLRARLTHLGHPLVASYVNDLTTLARGGRDVAPVVQDQRIYEGIDSIVPRVLSQSHHLRKAVRTPYEPSLRNTMTLYWDPYCSCTGINVEAINFLTALEERMQVRAVANPDCWCPGYPESDTQALGRLMKPKGGSGDEKYGPTAPTDAGVHAKFRRHSIWVTHKPVDAMPRFPYRGAVNFRRRPTYGVARTMIEVDRITPDWVRRLNDDPALDEIWVPANFLVEAFYKSGVKRSRKIVVIPEAIDTDQYDPAVVVPLPTVAGPHAPCPRCYKFFSNFKWEHRKGWDVLLRAYFTTFKRADNVALYLKTYLYMTQHPYDIRAIKAKVEAFARDELRVPMETLARFYILTGETPAREMPSMYASMDAFVLPTRGEGWGLPFQEAMAMGLPTIGTNWGGNTEFMNEEVAYMIPVRGLAPPGGQIGGFHGGKGLQEGDKLLPVHGSDKERHGDHDAKCAEPNGDALAAIMRSIYEDPAAAEAKGAQGRKHIIKYFSRPAVASRVIDRLNEIERALDASEHPHPPRDGIDADAAAAVEAPPANDQAVDDGEPPADGAPDEGGGHLEEEDPVRDTPRDGRRHPEEGAAGEDAKGAGGNGAEGAAPLEPEVGADGEVVKPADPQDAAMLTPQDDDGAGAVDPAE